MEKIIIHLDVNNAFLSWTAIDMLRQGQKDIRNEIAVIGVSSSIRKGIVLAKSVSAKEAGIVSGEPIFNASQKVAKLNVYQPNFELYSKMSNALFSLIYNYTPDIEVFSIDECFIDYTNVKKLYGDPIKFAYKLQKEISDKLGFTVNIGIANTKLCAKMASDFSKPNKIHTLFSNEVKEKLWPLAIDNLLWIGKKSSIKLKELGINTIGDLANSDEYMLSKYFKNQTKTMIEHANGIDQSIVSSDKWTPKGISNSTTFDHNLDDKASIYLKLSELCENVALSLRKENKYANVIGITIKDENFKSYSHQVKLLNATNITKEIVKVSKKLFDEAWNGESIRLIGVRLDNLTDKVNHQISLFEPLEEKIKDSTLDKTLDNLKDKYGDKIINPASIIKRNIKKKQMK